MNVLLPEFKELRKVFKGKFIIPEEVKREIIDKPMTINRFKFEALRLQQLLKDKILELPNSLAISNEEILKRAKEIDIIANSLFSGRGKDVKIIDSGEIACLALSKILTEKGVTNVLAVDERTTRMLGEKPENLEKLLRKKLRTRVDLKKADFKFFKGFKFIRSSELVYIMYKKGIVKLKGPEVLDALLWAVKFKGCAISGDEIKEINRIS
jgi:hypothetical protein